ATDNDQSDQRLTASLSLDVRVEVALDPKPFEEAIHNQLERWNASLMSLLEERRKSAPDPGHSPPNEPVPTRAAKRTRGKKGGYRSSYEKIDAALRTIAEVFPKSHREVFGQLQDRRVGLPPAKPFLSANGWMAGFKQDQTRARSWLSKRWARLKLP